MGIPTTSSGHSSSEAWISTRVGVWVSRSAAGASKRTKAGSMPRNLPGRGCIFIVDLPRHFAVDVSIRPPALVEA